MSDALPSDDSVIIGQLEQARELGKSNKDVFPQVVKQILNLSGNPNLAVQRWCAKYLKEAFSQEDILPAIKIELSIDALPHLKVLADVKDLEVFKNTIDVCIIVFKLTFRYVAENDGSGAASVWAGVNDIKNNLVAKCDTQFPFESSFDREHDSLRNIESKLELLKFVMVVIDYQLRSNSSKYFSISRVNPNHSLIKPQLMESEASALLMVVLKPLTDDILVSPLVTALMNHLSMLVRRKRQFAERILPILESFDSTKKLQSNYESLKSFKLAQKYTDRTLRVLLGYMTKLQLIPTKFQASCNRKLSELVAKGDEIRKKNIIQPSAEDSQIRKRKFEGFENPLKKMKVLDYKNLYCLTDISSEINQFDFSTIPQPILVNMAISALNRAPVNKLSKALDVISARYLDAVKDIKVDGSQASNAVSNGGESEVVVKDENDEDDDDKVSYDPETTYTLPPPKLLSFQEKKEHLNLIVKNFFQLANKGNKEEEVSNGVHDGSVSEELTKIAINSWKADSWLILLTRLATRGMVTVDYTKDGQEYSKNEQLSDLIRKALFDYFLVNIHERIDLVIEWLNEEWYNEKVANEQKVRDEIAEKWHARYKEDPESVSDLQKSIESEVAETDIPTPQYDKWGQQVLDAMIPFLEPTDRKIFLRLLSDLPWLNKEMVLGIKSLCADPARSKLGFLSLQFLIMYRPPAKAACIDLLKGLSEGEEEDLRGEASKLLAKYS